MVLRNIALANADTIRAAIFDFDGTLLDSLGVWDDIDKRSFAKRGMSVPSIFADTTAAMNPHQIADYVIEHCGFTDSPETLMQEWSDMAFDAYANQLPLKKGAYDYVHYLHASKVKLLLVTTLSQRLCLPALTRVGIADCFDFLQCGEDLPEAGKHSSRIYLDLASQFHIAPNNFAVFEDSHVALRSAQQAGMQTYGVVDDINAEISEDSPLQKCVSIFSDFAFAPKILNANIANS